MSKYVSELWFTVHGGGKLEGFGSLNTSSLNNNFCEQMSSCERSICSQCYARRGEKFKKNAKEKFTKNGKKLSGEIIPSSALPDIDGDSDIPETVRIHSHGEVIDEAHAVNIVNIIRNNPETRFSWYTKRVSMVIDAFNGRKPENLVLVWSNPITGTVVETDVLPDQVDKAFNVVEDGESHDINCGGKDCASCRECYKFNTETTIIEKAK